MNKSPLLLAAATLLCATSAHAEGMADMGKGKADMEKCYGVAKAGKNDCGNASGTHGCAGHAKNDGDGGEWLFVPKGTCDKLTGGSLKPKA